MGAAVHGYRVYIIGRNGHIMDRVDVFAESEDDAKAQAKKLVESFAVELWEGSRMIATFEPKG